MAWNSQVSHILATASQSGATIVWDLRQKKPWCELRDAASQVLCQTLPGTPRGFTFGHGFWGRRQPRRTAVGPPFLDNDAPRHVERSYPRYLIR